MKNNTLCGIIPLMLGFALIFGAVALTAYNLFSDKRAENTAKQVVEQFEIPSVSFAESDTPESPSLPLYMRYPDMEMPVQKIKGNYYIGILELPSLGLELPVLQTLTVYNLTVSPCRYKGSAYKDNFVIGAHNYISHFGNLADLSYGDEVYFTDCDGNRFAYVVSAIEILKPTDVEEMESGNWPLTMFTCTFGGASRVTVRCDRL